MKQSSISITMVNGMLNSRSISLGVKAI